MQMLNENIAKIYVSLIKKGIKTLDSIPENIKPFVEKLLGVNGV